MSPADEEEEPLTPSLGIRITGACSFFFLATASLLANLCLAIALTKYRLPSPSAFGFLLISWQLTVSDVMSQCIQLVLAVPLTLTAQPIFGHGLLLNGIAFFDTLSYNATLFFAALMTLNRLTVFFWPWLNNALFHRPRIYSFIAAIWLYVAVFCAALNLGGCGKAFAENGFYFFHNCTHPTPAFTLALRSYYSAMTTYLPVAMLAAYLTIFIHIRWAKRRSRVAAVSRQGGGGSNGTEVADSNSSEEVRAKLERSLLLQSFLICGFLELQNLAFNFLAGLSLAGQWSYSVNILENWISIGNSSMTAVVLLTFNDQIRSRAWQMCKCCGGRTRISPAAPREYRVKRLPSTFVIS